MAEIADRLDTHSSTIQDWLDKHNIPTRTIAESNSDGDVMKLHDSEWLRNQYHGEEKSTYDIADELGVSENAVSEWLNRNGIQTTNSYQDQASDKTELLHDKEWLDEQYHDKGHTLYEIAEMCDCAHQTVRYWMQRHGLETDSYSESFTEGDIQQLQNERWLREQYHSKERNQQEIAEALGVSQTTVSEYMAKLRINCRSRAESSTDGNIQKAQDEQFLRKMYWEEGMTTTNIADTLNLSQTTVSRYMDDFNISTREDYHPTGKDHPNYTGDEPKNGKYYGPNWKVQRLKTLRRDQARCRRCGMTESEHYDKYNRALHIHHITNKREFMNEKGLIDWQRANKVENLITLCIACHHTVERFPVDLDMR